MGKMVDETFLVRLKEEIENATQKLNELQGRRSMLLERLEKEHKISNPKEIPAELEKMKKKSRRLEEQIQEKLTYIKENFDL